MTNVLALVTKIDGCSAWRILQPFAELQRRGYRAEWGYRTDDRLGYLVHNFNAVILPRLSWTREQRADSLQWMAALRKAGIAIIYEVDDDMFSNVFYDRLIHLHGKTVEYADELCESIRHVVGQADGVTVSSQRLATIVREYTDRPVEVVRNYIDLEWFKAVQAHAVRQVKGLTIGWAGGIRPDKDVEEMAVAWGRIAAMHPAVRFVVIGHQPAVIREHVPAEKLTTLPFVPVEEYPLTLVNIDIGCCPLADNFFNRAKTWIKALEYGATGAPVVASPTVYGKLIQDGHDGYIVNSADEWTAALDALVSNANHRQHMTQRLQSKIHREHSLAANVLRWPVAWTSIYEDFEDRTRARVHIPTGWRSRVGGKEPAAITA